MVETILSLSDIKLTCVGVAVGGLNQQTINLISDVLHLQAVRTGIVRLGLGFLIL